MDVRRSSNFLSSVKKSGVDLATVADVPSTETIQDVIGAMVSGNTETGISVTYDDSDGTLDFVAEVTQAELDAVSSAIPSTEALQDLVGAMVSGGTETGITVSYDDTNARLDFVAEVTQAELDAVSAAIPSTEVLQDLIGAMVSGGTETGVAVSYDDTNARLDFVAEVTTAMMARPETFSRSGALAVLAGTQRWYADDAYVIVEVRASVGVAPTGASLIVDVHKNGTTIFTTQGNRPTIAASGFTDGSNVPDTTSLADGDYLTIDVDQIGSTIAGSDLTVQVLLRRTA